MKQIHPRIRLDQSPKKQSVEDRPDETPRADTTRQCQPPQGSRSIRAGMLVVSGSEAAGLAVVSFMGSF